MAPNIVPTLCPPAPPPEVCLKEPMSVADSLYNLQLVRDFCCRHLRMRCPLALEDLLYMPAAIKVRGVMGGGGRWGRGG